ncbi:MAG: serine/threonine-protein kinase [Kiritimatiellia bacterium]
MEKVSESGVPERIGRWTVVRLLGRGGMAEVYEVEDPQLGSRYALKLFTYARAEKESARARFFSEGRLLARLDHPRLVRVYEVDEDAATGRPYFVMDLVVAPDGKPRTLAEVEAPDEEQVAMWYEDLRAGLDYIHAKGILHRDLKLQNVLVGPDGHVVLSDFGIAKIFDPDLRADLGLSLEQTLIAARDGQKTVMGSVGYLAPEVEMGVAASKESDWYALGVLVFHLLTGVWCDARTDVVGDLETFNPTWLKILPKLLHLNPAGRACPSWTELERARREEEAYRTEKQYADVRDKLRRAKASKKWLVVSWLALLAASLGTVVPLLMRTEVPDFESVCRVSDSAPTEDVTKDELELARVDAWVLTRGLFADLKAGRIPQGKVADEILRMAKAAGKDELDIDEELGLVDGESWYDQVSDSAALAKLLYNIYSNLCQGASR